MVVWLFAGGGESEIRGLVPFLRKHLGCLVERKTPVRRKPGPRPARGRAVQNGYGYTGKSLEQQIARRLRAALMKKGHCDLILVLDDLDCRDAVRQEMRFKRAIDSVAGAKGISRCIGFAAPELEAWIIADWRNSVARDVDFRRHHQGMRWWLSHEKGVSFDAPETFSVYDERRDACADKLSDAIIQAAQVRGNSRYSKALHTPRLLLTIDPQVVASKCPLFRRWYICLSRLTQERV